MKNEMFAFLHVCRQNDMESRKGSGMFNLIKCEEDKNCLPGKIHTRPRLKTKLRSTTVVVIVLAWLLATGGLSLQRSFSFMLAVRSSR